MTSPLHFDPPLGTGDIFVWVGTLYADLMKPNLEAMRNQGVHTVFYATDAGVAACSLKRTLGTAVKEVWEYTHANQLFCDSSQRVRYVPPGYLPRGQLAQMVTSRPVLIFPALVRGHDPKRGLTFGAGALPR